MKKNPTDSFIALDEEGYLLQGDVRVTDEALGQEVLNHLKHAENNSFVSTFGGREVFVEAFDEPLIARTIQESELAKEWEVNCAYHTRFKFDLHSLCLDEWDRFHGRTSSGIPFVFSRQAQNQFFNLLQEFDDDSITWQNERILISSLYKAHSDLDKEKWWSDVYLQEENPRWNLAEPAEALKDMLPRLKLPRARILVLGCGEGHDAAYFAKDGHIVTGIDISPHAIERAQKHYGSMKNLTFKCADLFNLPTDFDHQFDYLFEYTCYCAINPTRRSELVRIWNRLLAEGGHLIGVFFCMDKPEGPPFGGSEWEIRERLKKYYDFLFWGRWRQSLARRQGRELFVFARKKFD